MSVYDRFDSGTAQAPLATHIVDFSDMVDRVRIAMNSAIAAVSPGDHEGRDLSDILKSMWETHGSMVSIYKAAERQEIQEGKRTGRWMDALLLARPQYDALFVALLLAYDYVKWNPAYRKAGWAAEARQCLYVHRRYKKAPAGRPLHAENLQKLKKLAGKLKVTPKEWAATTGEVRGNGDPCRCGATNADIIKRFPTPGEIVNRNCNMLAGGPYEHLAQLLWQQWKFLCDPAHIGMSLLAFKSVLRGDGEIGDADRDSAIEERVIGGAIYPSFVAIMTLVTVLALRVPRDVGMRTKVTQGWKDLDEGTLEGSIIWTGWARQALQP
jgi:hypothetical protein